MGFACGPNVSVYQIFPEERGGGGVISHFRCGECRCRVRKDNSPDAIWDMRDLYHRYFANRYFDIDVDETHYFIAVSIGSKNNFTAYKSNFNKNPGFGMFTLKKSFF